MKKICLVILFLSFANMGFTQGKMVELHVGEKVKGVFKQFLEEDSGSIYAIMAKGKKYYLRKFDSQSLEQLQEWRIGEFKYAGREVKFLFGNCTRKGFHLVFEVYDRSQNISYFLEQLITREGVLGEVREVAVANQIDEEGRAEVYLSQDSSIFSIFIPPIEKRAPRVFVFDDEWDFLWETTVEVPDGGDLFKITQVELTNRGELLIVGYSYSGFEPLYEVRPTADYKILKVTKNQVKVFSIAHYGKLFHSLNVKSDILEDFVVAGFYSDNDSEDAFGMFYAKLSSEGMEPVVEKFQVASEIYRTISNDLDGVSVLSMGKTKKGFSGVRINQCIILNNGQVAIVGERNFRDISTASGYVIGEIVIAAFDDYGNSEWITVVPKIQISGILYMESYAFHIGEDGMYLLYNDDLKNAERINSGEDAKRAKTYGDKFGLICARVLHSGELKMEAVASRYETKAIMLMRKTYSPDLNTLIMGESGSRLTVLRFK